MTAWLTSIVGETAAPVVAIITWLAITIVVVLLLIWLFRLLISGRLLNRHNPDLRLQVVDATAIDNRRKLVLVRRDNVEHLIIIGGTNDIVVESGIGAATSQNTENRPATVAPRPVQKSQPRPAPPAQRPAQPPQAPVSAARPDPAPKPVTKPQAAIAPSPAAPVTPAAPVEPTAPAPAAPTAAPAVSIDNQTAAAPSLDEEMDALINTLTTKNG